MGDDEQYAERFDMENDYEGGQWINGEFFYTRKKDKRKQTRDDQIYGVFGDSSDSDGGRRKGRRRRKGGQGDDDDGASYDRPVSFVSKGHVGGDPPKPAAQKQGPKRQHTPEDVEVYDDDDDGDIDDSLQPHAGLGAGPRQSSERVVRAAADADADDVAQRPSFGGLGSGSGSGRAPAFSSAGRAGLGLGAATSAPDQDAAADDDGAPFDERLMPNAFGKR